MSGKFGNTLDAKPTKDSWAEMESSDSDLDVETGGSGPGKNLLHQRKKEEAEICINYSVTKPCCMELMDRSCGYIPIDGTKPCLFTVAMFEDFRKRHFHSNILRRVYDDLVPRAYLSHAVKAKGRRFVILYSD